MDIKSKSTTTKKGVQDISRMTRRKARWGGREWKIISTKNVLDLEEKLGAGTE